MKTLRHAITYLILALLLTLLAVGTAASTASAEIYCPDFVFCAVDVPADNG